jgi:hypothetical protein
LQCSICEPDIAEYYDASVRVMALQRAMMESIVGSTYAAKVLASGRVVLVNTPVHRNAPAIILKGIQGAKGAARTTFSCLVLADQDKSGTAEKGGFIIRLSV